MSWSVVPDYGIGVYFEIKRVIALKIEFDKIKNVEKVNDVLINTKAVGKKVALNAKNGVTTIVKKTKNDSYARKLKKFNPLFPEHYKSESFNLPNMIKIVDDAVRRDIDVCEGSIGWLGKNGGMELLFLYDEAVSFSGIQFVPAVTCDAFYYVDSFDRNKYIRTDCIFSKAHEERLAELKNIAYLLGAKRCVIEIDEESFDSRSQGKKVNLSEKYNYVSANESAELKLSLEDSSKRSGHIEIEFEGSSSPERPVLKWFAHDDNINRLIDMRCNDVNSIKSETLELSGATSATMSQKTACAIDGAIGGVGKANSKTSMDAQAAKEHRSKLMYSIEF